MRAELGRAVVKDMHAEVLAVKALRIYLEDKPRDYTNAVEYWLYTSAVPCGDASTLSEDIYESGSTKNPSTIEGVVRGRSAYGQLGLCRTKPARADAPPTHCMSCSDKLARWCCVGVQGVGLLNRIHRPVYLKGIVIGEEGRRYHEAINRALNVRTPSVEVGRFRRHTLDILYTPVKFDSDPTLIPSNTSIVWWRGMTKAEYIVDGFKQGACIKSPSDISPRSYSILKGHRILPPSETNASSPLQKQYQEAKTAFHSSPAIR